MTRSYSNGAVFEIGQRVEWLYTPRGGYGFTSLVPATVHAIGRKRVTIAAKLARGGAKLVTVKPENLRSRRTA